MTPADALKRSWQIGAALMVVFLAAYCQPQRGVQKPGLPALSARIDNTSVSGISSGAYMAGQFEMAEARIVTGAAIIAGGPYGCSESVFADAMPGAGTAFLNLSKAVNGCMLDLLSVWGVGDPDALAEKAKKRAAEGEIGPLSDIVTDKVYLFSGQSDHTVMPAIVDDAAKFYAKLGLPSSNIKFVSNLPAGHAFVTEDAGGECSRSGEPYVVDCDYDQAGDLLRHIYGALKPRDATATGDYVTFSQEPYIAGLNTGLASEGVVYIPQACRSGGCSIHIAFHGCAQNQQTVGDAFIKTTGFARWADTNKLIVVFPQVATSALNPQGCWDWWGYTGRDYLTKKAPQIIAVTKMLEDLGRGGRTS